MRLFKNVPAAKVGRSVFNLSYRKLFDCDMGQLIPIMVDEVLPGDIWKIGNQTIIRMQPLVAPVLHPINVTFHYFFVNNRNIDEAVGTKDWVDYITGGDDGLDDQSLNVWTPQTTQTDMYSLWDYFGFPITDTPGTPVVPTGTLPVSYPLFGYNMIWNAYYRDENVQSERSIGASSVAYRNWEKDYFTSALPWQQRGTAPALPTTITGSDVTSAVFQNDAQIFLETPASSGSNQATMYYNSGTNVPYDAGTKNTLENSYIGLTAAGLNSNNTVTVDGTSFDATTFNIADLRLAFQIQRWMEINARCGVRYPEFLLGHFGVTIPDAQWRPEYIGGCKFPLIISEVLQTSESNTTPQGTLAGHGITVGENYVGKYRAKEHGWIIGLMSIMPKRLYDSQGINRQFIKESRYDFYSPEFAHLSEQGIYQAELYVTSGNQTENETIFGYQGRWDEYRTKQSMVCGNMRGSVSGGLGFWHISEVFDSAPSLNTAFIKCDPRKDIFAVTDEPGFICEVGNLIKCIRPMPFMSVPGMIDH